MTERPAAQPAEVLFEDVVARFVADADVMPPSASRGRTFGASALKVNGKIFAMLVNGELVVKLPKQRVDELVSSKRGRPFDPGHGRVMKEWITVSPAEGREWGALAQEARQFVAGTPPAA